MSVCAMAVCAAKSNINRILAAFKFAAQNWLAIRIIM